MTQESARKIEPRTIRVVQRDCGHTEGREGDSGYDLVPVKANPKKALKGARSMEVLDNGESMQYALFEVDMVPSKATEPERAEHYCPAHFATESTFAQGSVDGLGLYRLARVSRDRGGGKGIIHLAQPNGE